MQLFLRKRSLFILHLPFKGYLIAIIFLQKNLARTCKVLTEIGMEQSGNGKYKSEKNISPDFEKYLHTFQCIPNT